MMFGSFDLEGRPPCQRKTFFVYPVKCRTLWRPDLSGSYFLPVSFSSSWLSSPGVSFFFYRSKLFRRPGESTKLKVSRSTSISRSGCNLSHDVSFFFFFFSRILLAIFSQFIRDTKFFFSKCTFLSR